MAKTVKKQPGRSSPAKVIPATPIIGNEMVSIIILCLILALISFIRIRLSSYPLERDEGEYAYFGQLILDGIPPYKMAYNLKFPGTYYCYALIMSVFGQSTAGIRFGLLLFNLGTLVFLYLVTKKLFNSFTALIAVLTTGLLLLSPSVLGQAAHATHFVTFFMMGGTWFLVTATEKKRGIYFLLSGVMMGLAFIMKQSGIFFIVFGALIILLNSLQATRPLRKSLPEFLIYCLGVFLVIGVLFIVIYLNGVFQKFWFWTIIYPEVYSSRIPLTDAWGTFTKMFLLVAGVYSIFWVLAGLGHITLFFSKPVKASRLFVVLFVVCSFLPAVPGFYFRQHYFVPLLPVVGLLTGVFFNSINLWLEKHFKQVIYLTAGVFGIIVLNQLNVNKNYLFKSPVKDLCQLTYHGNMFEESIPLAKYIESTSGVNDRVFVFGSEPQVYFYSKRKSATGYIYMYDLSFEHRYRGNMEAELTREVERADPAYILYSSGSFSWLASKGVTDSLFNWFNRHMAKNKFFPVGYADYRYPEPTVYAWDSEARTFRPRSDTYMVIFRKAE